MAINHVIKSREAEAEYARLAAIVTDTEAQIVLQHHERLNGSGYPQGLTSPDILLEARILAVADVVEAMAAHRPYRPGLGVDKALEEVTTNQGTLYDPQIVEACVQLFTKDEFQF